MLTGSFGILVSFTRPWSVGHLEFMRIVKLCIGLVLHLESSKIYTFCVGIRQELLAHRVRY